MMVKIAKSIGRPVDEWIGASPDSKVPPRVQLRILRRFSSKCYLTSIIIADGQKFDLEHIKPLEEGGEHRESNLAPVLRLAHEIKTAAERKRQAKADNAAKRAHGLHEPRSKLQSRNDLRGPEKPRDRPRVDKSALAPLPRRVCGVIVE